MFIFIIILLSIIIVGAIVILFRNYRTMVLQLEYIINMYNKWVLIYNLLLKLDKRQMFLSDDEVGILFNAIKQVITDYTELLSSDLNETIVTKK